MKKITTILLFFIVICCRNSSSDTFRAFAEGSISGINTNETVDITIINNNVVIAKTSLASDGGFQLSGPMISEGFSLGSSKKIKSFSAVQNGLSISQDSMKILVPKEINYVKFNEIKLKK